MPYLNGPDWDAQIAACPPGYAEFDFEHMTDADAPECLRILQAARAKGIMPVVYGRACKSFWAWRMPGHKDDGEQRRKSSWFARSFTWRQHHSLTTRYAVDAYTLADPREFNPVQPNLNPAPPQPEYGWARTMQHWGPMTEWGIDRTREEMPGKTLSVEVWHRLAGNALAEHGREEARAINFGLAHYDPLPLWLWRYQLEWCKNRGLDVIWWGQPPGEVLGHPELSRYDQPEPLEDILPYYDVACDVFGVKPGFLHPTA